MGFFGLILRALLHCTLMAAAPGKDRIKFSLFNAIAVVITVLLAVLGIWLLNNVTGFVSGGIQAGVEAGESNAAGGVMVGFWATIGGIALGFGGGILCIILAVISFAYGVLSEFVLAVCALISVIAPSEKNPRKDNVITMLISLAVIAVAIVTVVLIFKFVF